MERREFLKLTLGFVAAAAAITGTVAQAAPLPQAGDTSKPTDTAAAAKTEADELEQEVAARDDDLAVESGDTDISARRWWRVRRRYWRRRRRWWRRRRFWYRRRRRVYWRRRRRWWRRRRVIYY